MEHEERRYELQPEFIEVPFKITSNEGVTYYVTHIFRPITQEAWIDYFDRLESIFEMSSTADGEDAFVAFQPETGADRNLWLTFIDRVEGYAFDDNVDWKTALADNYPNHIEEAVAALTLTTRPTRQRSLLEDQKLKKFKVSSSNDTSNITIRVLQAQDGQFHEIDVVHQFRSPNLDDYRQYKLATRRIKQTTGSRLSRGKMIAQTATKELLKLWDEMKVSVDGYSIGGTPVGQDDISQQRAFKLVPVPHKITAVREVFERAQTQISNKS